MKSLSIVLAFVLFAAALPAQAVGQAKVRNDLGTLVQGNADFAFDLYGKIQQDKENRGRNLFCSPYSISTALAMTYGGAQGETAEQMARVLHFQLDQKRLHAACAALTRELNGHGLPRDYQLNVANSLWGQDNFSFVEDYEKMLRVNYGSRIRRANFAGEPEPARERINRWVEERTNNKIKNLLVKDDIDKFTRLVLVNAIYFKAAWETPFDPRETAKDVAFQTAGPKPAKVALMQNTASFAYLDGGSFQALELPYEGRELSMVVFLPKEKTGLDQFEQTLTAAKLNRWLASMKPAQVAVGLPRFKVVSRFNLKEVLENMGMPLAFKPLQASFAGMTTQAPLYISKVIHKAFVDVNEEGTEAAAATAVIMATPPSGLLEAPIVFRADHPFVFLIRDNRTGAILFLGRVTNPTPAGE